MNDQISNKVFSGINDLPRGYATEKTTHGCLVLEGGAFRAIYTEGIIDYLAMQDIVFDCVVGVSAGAMNGANYVAGQIGRSARVNLRYRHDVNYVGVKPMITDGGVIGFDYIFGDLPYVEPFDYSRFNSEKYRFIVVATDVNTGKTEYFEKGKCTNIFQAIKASASMPYISQPVKVENSIYLDGGCSCNIPYQWAINQGYDKIVVIKTRHNRYRESDMSISHMHLISHLYKEYPDFANALMNMNERYNLELDELNLLHREGRVFVFSPSEPLNIGRLEQDIEKLGALYYLGRQDCIDNFDSFMEYMNK